MYIISSSSLAVNWLEKVCTINFRGRFITRRNNKYISHKQAHWHTYRNKSSGLTLPQRKIKASEREKTSQTAVKTVDSGCEQFPGPRREKKVSERKRVRATSGNRKCRGRDGQSSLRATQHAHTQVNGGALAPHTCVCTKTQTLLWCNKKIDVQWSSRVLPASLHKNPSQKVCFFIEVSG